MTSFLRALSCATRVLTLTTVLCFVASGCDTSSEDDDSTILARIDDATVTKHEFVKRFELTPRLRNFPSLEEAKKSALLSLIGEKILAAEGYKRGLDSDPTLGRLMEEIEREVVVEEVYRERVKKRVEVSEKELRKAYEASKHVMRVQYFALTDSLAAHQAEVMLRGGTDFSQVAHLANGVGHDGEVPTKTVEWGESDVRLEQAALKLKPGEVSGPIRIGKQTFFLRMQEHLVNRFMSEDDFQQQRPRLEKVLTNRKETRIFARYLHELMADNQVSADPKIYGWLVRNLEELFEIEDQQSRPQGRTILREEIEWSEITSDLGDQLHATLLTFNEGSWTVDELLERLWFGSYPLNTKSKADFRAGFYKTIERMVEDEFLAREGFREGLDQRASVRDELRIWEESLVAARMRKMVLDTISITDAQIRAHFDAHPERFDEPEMVKVQEVLVQDRALARTLVQQIREGADMAALARRYSVRKGAHKNGGILDFFPKHAHGKLSDAAFSAAVGAVKGPVQIGPQAFSVFKVLGRKHEKRAVFQQAYHLVKQDLHGERSRMAINRFLRGSLGSPVQVAWPALDSLQVSSINLLTMKLGFPGRLAAPMIHYLDGLGEELIGANRINTKPIYKSEQTE